MDGLNQARGGGATRRELLHGAASLAGAALVGGCARSEPTRRPNVVFFLADQMRTDACGPYGGRNVPTPELDRLAREGLTFERALSTAPVCAPYRGMLMTGRSPFHSGLLINRVDFSPEQNPHCIGNLFAAEGYRTGYIGKWHLAAGARKYAGLVRRDAAAVQAHVERDPEAEFIPPGPMRLGFDHWEGYNYHHEFNSYWYYRDEPVRIRTQRFETDVQTDQAIAYMRAREQDQEPFCLFVSPHPPHPPFNLANVPAGYYERVAEDLQWRPNVPMGHPRRSNPMEMRCYLAMCANIDANVGRLLDFLDASPLGNDTLFVFSSDHGEMHGSHGLQNKMVAYEESVHVPLIARWPGRVPAGARTGVLQTPMDHLPTFCALSGIQAPPEVDGVDLSPTFLGGKQSERDAVLLMNCSSHFSFFQTGTDFPEWRGVRTKSHTYVRWLDGREHLFDDVEDPFQMTNLAGDAGRQSLLTELRERLIELMAAADDEFLPGTAYADWYDDERRLVRTALGPVS